MFDIRSVNLRFYFIHIYFIIHNLDSYYKNYKYSVLIAFQMSFVTATTFIFKIYMFYIRSSAKYIAILIKYKFYRIKQNKYVESKQRFLECQKHLEVESSIKERTVKPQTSCIPSQNGNTFINRRNQQIGRKYKTKDREIFYVADSVCRCLRYTCRIKCTEALMVSS